MWHMKQAVKIQPEHQIIWFEKLCSIDKMRLKCLLRSGTTEEEYEQVYTIGRIIQINHE